MAGTDSVVAIGVLPDQLEVILDTDHRPRVAGKGNDGDGAEDGIHGSALEPELAKVRPRQQRIRHREELCGRGVLLDDPVDRRRLSRGALSFPHHVGRLSAAVRGTGGGTRLRATGADTA
jgi:hypothetical protein